MLLDFTVIIHIEPDDDGFHAWCPALKGLHVDGGTEEETVRFATEAAEAYLESLIKNHEPIPLGVVLGTSDVSKETTTHTERLAVPVPA